MQPFLLICTIRTSSFKEMPNITPVNDVKQDNTVKIAVLSLKNRIPIRIKTATTAAAINNPNEIFNITFLVPLKNIKAAITAKISNICKNPPTPIAAPPYFKCIKVISKNYTKLMIFCQYIMLVKNLPTNHREA